MQITMAGTCFFYDFDKQHCFAPDFQIYLLVYNMFCTWLTNLAQFQAHVKVISIKFISSSFQGHSKVIARSFQGHFKVISSPFQAHVKVISRHFKSFQIISRSFQGHFKIVSSSFQGHFKVCFCSCFDERR